MISMLPPRPSGSSQAELGYRYFGVVQAGYRQVLQTISVSVESGLSAVSPATEVPSTPRSHSRNLSSGTIPVSDSATRENTPKAPSTPFSNNSFMSVPVDHVPTSPTIKNKMLRNKRDRDAGAGREIGPAKKKRTT
jgi:hypothetical protein